MSSVAEKISEITAIDALSYSADKLRRDAILSVVLKTMVYSIVAIIGCELFARFIVFVGKPAASENPQYHLKYLVANKLVGSDDNILLCGDSLMKAGLYPELVSARLRKINSHIKVTNLAVNGSDQNDTIAYLEYLRNRGVQPKLVVFDYEVSNTGICKVADAANGPAKIIQRVSVSNNNPDTLVPRPDASKGYVFNGLLSRPKDFFGTLKIAMDDHLYFVRHRGNIKRFVLDFFRAIKYPDRFERKAYVQLSDNDFFGTTQYGMAPNHGLLSDENRLEQKKAIWTFHPRSPQVAAFSYDQTAYDPIIRYCQNYKIPLILVWLPHQSTIYKEFYYCAPYTESWFKQKFELYAREPFVHPLYLNTLDEDSSYYSDYRHLSTYGCVKSSELFSAALSEPKYRGLISR